MTITIREMSRNENHGAIGARPGTQVHRIGGVRGAERSWHHQVVGVHPAIRSVVVHRIEAVAIAAGDFQSLTRGNYRDDPVLRARPGAEVDRIGGASRSGPGGRGLGPEAGGERYRGEQDRDAGAQA